VVCVTGTYVDAKRDLANAKPGADRVSLGLSYPRYSNQGYKTDKFGAGFPVSRADAEALAKRGKQHATWLKQTQDAALWTVVSDPKTECPPEPGE
jgi:hypothetical protein